jgi:hypothetical protein
MVLEVGPIREVLGHRRHVGGDDVAIGADHREHREEPRVEPGVGQEWAEIPRNTTVQMQVPHHAQCVVEHLDRPRRAFFVRDREVVVLGDLGGNGLVVLKPDALESQEPDDADQQQPRHPDGAEHRPALTSCTAEYS